MITAVRKILAAGSNVASDHATRLLLGARIPAVVTDLPGCACWNAFEHSVLRESATSMELYTRAVPNKITAPLIANSTRIVDKLSPPESRRLHACPSPKLRRRASGGTVSLSFGDKPSSMLTALLP